MKNVFILLDNLKKDGAGAGITFPGSLKWFLHKKVQTYTMSILELTRYTDGYTNVSVPE